MIGLLWGVDRLWSVVCMDYDIDGAFAMIKYSIDFAHAK